VAVVAWAVFASIKLLPRASIAVATLLILQLCLGIANVLAGLPLWLAAAHNAGAALLLVSLVVLNFFSSR
jgi:heme a synthase